MKTCKLCKKPVKSRGFCNHHYYIYYKIKMQNDIEFQERQKAHRIKYYKANKEKLIKKQSELQTIKNWKGEKPKAYLRGIIGAENISRGNGRLICKYRSTAGTRLKLDTKNRNRKIMCMYEVRKQIEEGYVRCPNYTRSFKIQVINVETNEVKWYNFKEEERRARFCFDKFKQLSWKEFL